MERDSCSQGHLSAVVPKVREREVVSPQKAMWYSAPYMAEYRHACSKRVPKDPSPSWGHPSLAQVPQNCKRSHWPSI